MSGKNEKVKMKTAKCKIQLSHMECGSRAAAFLVSDLFFQPLQREACRFDPMSRTFDHTLPWGRRAFFDALWSGGAY